jgi:hypothetical protein
VPRRGPEAGGVHRIENDFHDSIGSCLFLQNHFILSSVSGINRSICKKIHVVRVYQNQILTDEQIKGFLGSGIPEHQFSLFLINHDLFVFVHFSFQDHF